VVGVNRNPRVREVVFELVNRVSRDIRDY